MHNSFRAIAHEIPTLLRASASSVAASVLDLIAYQLILFAILDNYTIAAIVGAVVGGVTNFSINRFWAFPRTSRSLRLQGLMYVLASGAVYVGFQACLMFLIEILHMDEHWAWFPAQFVAWVGVSYPLFRFFVFARPTSVGRPLEGS